MNQGQTLLGRLGEYLSETTGGMHQRPIGFYTFFFLLPALVVLILAYVLLPLILYVILDIDPAASVSVLHRLLVVPFGWILAGLAVCLLLYLWVKFKPPAILVTLALAVLWGLSVARYVQGQDPVPWMAHFLNRLGIPLVQFRRFLLIVLPIGVVVVPPLWFLRPLEGFFGLPFGWTSAVASSLGWLLLWLLLTIGLQEYQVGSVLVVSLLISGGVFLFGLYVGSGFLLPLPQPNGREEALRLLRDYTVDANRPCYAVVDEPHQEGKVRERIGGQVFGYLAEGPGVVLSDCDHAVAISDGLEFKGLADPGVVFTGLADRPVQAIDLRPQLRTFDVSALTKDGIAIRVGVFIPFKIDAGRRQPRLGEYLPHDKSAAFRAIHAQQAQHEEGAQTSKRTEHRRWADLPRPIAERILQNIISKYTFDDLYGPHQPGGKPPRTVIEREFQEQLAAELKPIGIQVVGWRAGDPTTLQARIGNLEPVDPQVYADRVRSWQADWTRKVMLRQARGHMERLRIVERARAETRADLIISLGRQLEDLSAAKTQLHPKAILNRFVSALEDVARQPAVRGLLPAETRQAVEEIRSAVPD